MKRNRRRIDIIADILKAVEKSAVKKTRIMHFANLSYALLEKYLDDVINLGFICYNNNGYEATEKGRIFLQRYMEFSVKNFRIERELEKLRFEKGILEKMCTSLKES